MAIKMFPTMAAVGLSTLAGMVLTTPATAGGTYFDVTTRFVAEDGYGGGGFDMEYYGTYNGVRGWAVATTSCNMGNKVAPWSQGTGTQPVIAQNCYRLHEGRFEQIGMSWLKHSCCAVSEPGCNSPFGGCQSTGCSTLGIGCADTYWAGLNADADAPRCDINAFTGQYDYPFSISPSGPSAVRGKLQLVDEDYLDYPGALYFVEGQYVEPGESVEGDELRQNNNASHRQVKFNSATSATGNGAYETQHEVPALWAWQDLAGANVLSLPTLEQQLDGDWDGEGRVNVGWLVTDNGDGTWHYEYAVNNQNSHRCIDEFSVPVPSGTTLTNVEFKDVHYHSGEENVIYGTDWTFQHVNGAATWTAVEEGYWDEDQSGDPVWVATTNAIRWATMYNFRFDADAPPVMATITMPYWRAGPETAIQFDGQGPDAAGCPGDLNGDNVVNVDDILVAISGFGDEYNVEDILEVLAYFGTGC